MELYFWLLMAGVGLFLYAWTRALVYNFFPWFVVTVLSAVGTIALISSRM
jgi:hypothetical protein